MPSAFGHELEELWPLVEAARARWAAAAEGGSVRGRPHVFGEIQTSTAIALYDLIREVQPERVVETGVCNGVSTAVVLWALERNGSGTLWSIDLPEYAGRPSADHWEGKGGSVVPDGLEPGWLVPGHLRHRWRLTIGRSQDLLEQVLAEAAPLDMFIHDSEHSYECMSFELSLARQHLRRGGWLLADDARRNDAYAEQTYALHAVELGEAMLAARLPATAWPACGRRRPTVAVSVNALNAESRLPRLLDEAASFADEIVVGVDAASTDATLDIARDGADVVYRFRHDGEPSPARTLALEHTSCDWVLLLDDDEGVDAAFPDLLPELLADERYTHWWLMRRWVVGLDPCRHLAVEPWYPEFALRMFRADPRLVWKPIGVHTGMRVMGPGGTESRASLLHYEPMLLDDAARAAKLAIYRARGSDGWAEEYYVNPSGVPTVVSETGPLRPPSRTPRRAARVRPEPIDLDLRPRHAPWNAELDVRLTPTATVGETLFGRATARNTGGLAWAPPNAVQTWPVLQLGYRTKTSRGDLLAVEGLRTPVPRWVDPGQSATLVCRAQAPPEPGDYVLEWQLVSEFECWFTDCGAEPARTPLRVTA